jgi:hypothetical protein
MSGDEVRIAGFGMTDTRSSGAPLRNDLDCGYCIGLVLVSYRCTASYTLYRLCPYLGEEDSDYLLIPLSIQYIPTPVWIPPARDKCVAMLEQVPKAGGQDTLSLLIV